MEYTVPTYGDFIKYPEKFNGYIPYNPYMKYYPTYTDNKTYEYKPLYTYATPWRNPYDTRL